MAELSALSCCSGDLHVPCAQCLLWKYGINGVWYKCSGTTVYMSAVELRRQGCKEVKRHGEHEGEHEGGYESKKALGNAWRGAHAQAMVQVLEKRWVEGSGEEGPRIQRPTSQRDGLCEK